MINTQALQEARGKARLERMGSGSKSAPVLNGPSFQSLLDGALDRSGPIKFSAHAQERLEARGIVLNEGDLDRLQGAMNDAAAKGGRDAVLLMDRFAFVVSVPNRTVITAMPKQDAGSQVFTKIDTAVVVPNVTVPDLTSTGRTPIGEAVLPLNDGRGTVYGGLTHE